jgi:hypothetical protein
MQDALKTSTLSRSGPNAYDVGAGMANLAYVPGKAILCALGASVGVVLLVLTAGSGYKAATAAGEEGCGGKWILTGNDLQPAQPFQGAYAVGR